MDLFMQYLITGLTVGSIYALLAVGFVTIYNVTGILNLAQGEFAMIGALSCVTFVNLGIPILGAIPLAILLTALIGFGVERLAIFPARNATTIILIVITLGVSIFLKGMGLIIWGTSPKPLPSVIEMKPIQFMGAVINPQSIFIFAVLIILLVVLYWFFEKTFIGSALRASEKNPRAASLMGVNINTMSSLAFTLAAALGALAGVMIAPLTDATYEMGFFIGIKGFVAMIFGGMHSIPGAVAGGLLLGIIEAFSGGYISTYYSDAIAFAFLLFVLFYKPNGLFATATGERV
ncbi:branched-chain amino acid ABC transporter permease [Sporosarcina sp. 179-K 3D1 HS]|uniref:branched-chain amino acid ABC transporter permease n=1 Tax=Sporosarcina sp. 179-K 3D1 HS TaxID=3232169 RepID=UPI0039A19BB1